MLSFVPTVEQLLLSAPTPPELADQVSAGLSAVQVNCYIFGHGLREPGLERLRQLAPALQSQRLKQSVRLLLAIAPRGINDSLAVLEAWADDTDPVVARLARMWSAVGYENEGNLVVARAMAEGALALCDDNDGPWMRALLTQQLGSFALQSGDFAAARAYQLEALPLLQEIGAHEDAVQVHTALALLALHSSDYERAQRLFDEVAGQDVGAQLVYGGGLLLMCGRAELLLCRGEVAAGLTAYAAAVESIRTSSIPGLTADGFEPMLLYTPAALVTASVRYGQRAQAYRDEVLMRAARVAGRSRAATFVDVPIAGLRALRAGGVGAGLRRPGLRRAVAGVRRPLRL